MKLEDYRNHYYEFSGKASEAARQLSFVGIAVVWIFKVDNQGPLAVPGALIFPAALFVLALGLDLLQYVWGALIWGAFSRHHERQGKKDSAELSAPPYFNWVGLVFFWGKLVAVIVGYILVFTHIVSLLG